MKKQVIIIVSVVVVIAMLGGMIVPLVSKGNAGSNMDNNAGNNAGETAEAAESGETPPSIQGIADLLNGGDASGEGSAIDPELATSDEDGGDDADASGAGSGGSGNSGGSSGNTNNNAGQQSSGGQSSGGDTPAIPTISFPYTIGETGLVVQQISPYNGYFIEDGSDSAVSGVATIVVTNNGSDLEFAGIGISQGERSLGFTAGQIPAGATVIIQEQNGAAFSSSDPYYTATATTTPVEKFEQSDQLVTVKDNGNNTLSVTNISGKTLKEVKIYFKNYLPEEDVYVGGITYNFTLNDVEPDTQTEVSAGHYDSKYSVVVEVIAEK